jgi:hypothetical protein
MSAWPQPHMKGGDYVTKTLILAALAVTTAVALALSAGVLDAGAVLEACSSYGC